VELWVWLAVAAAGLQTTRNALARSIAPNISPALNSWSRFAFNLPFSTTLAGTLIVLHGPPRLPLAFFGFCAATALAQLLGNVALVTAFRRGRFGESIVLHKLEVVFTAAIGVWLFGEDPSPAGWLGVALCALGVLGMNLAREGGPAGWRRAFHLDAAAALSLACALLLVAASFMLKEANALFVASNPERPGGFFGAAAQTLFHTTWIEVALLSLWIAGREPGSFRKVPEHWKRMWAIGATGFLGSLGWFWAYSLTLVAYVKAVGQIEAVLAVALALHLWKEKTLLRQLPGVALVVIGIGLVLLG